MLDNGRVRSIADLRSRNRTRPLDTLVGSSTYDTSEASGIRTVTVSSTFDLIAMYS